MCAFILTRADFFFLGGGGDLALGVPSGKIQVAGEVEVAHWLACMPDSPGGYTFKMYKILKEEYITLVPS